MHKFIISGAVRAGKTTLARRIQKDFGVSLIAGDAFMRAMEHSFPETGIVMVGDFEKNIALHSRFANHLLNFYDDYGHGYVLDSVHLDPQGAQKIYEREGQRIPTVFLGYAGVDPQQKLHDIRAFDRNKKCWTADRSDQDLLNLIRRQIDHSRRLSEECAKHHIPYIDTGHNYDNGIEDAFKTLRDFV